MTQRMTAACWDPVGPQGPHERAEIDLFANRTAVAYREEHPQAFDYPVGSAFRKIKYPSVGAEAPGLETSMERIASQGTVKDWRFRMRELPSGRVLLEDGASCLACHEKFESRGFVSWVSEQHLLAHLQPESRGTRGSAEETAREWDSKPKED